jgi:hypothetical protein
VTEPIHTASIAPRRIVLAVLIASSSRRVPTIKHHTPNNPVMSDRVPEKNPCDIAPVIKLMPIYFINIERWDFENVIEKKDRKNKKNISFF